MQYRVITNLEKRQSADVLILPFWKGKERAEEAADCSELKTAYQLPIHAKDFFGHEGELVWTYGQEPDERRLLLVGLGDKESIGVEKLRRAFGAAARACMAKKAVIATLLLPITGGIL